MINIKRGKRDYINNYLNKDNLTWGCFHSEEEPLFVTINCLNTLNLRKEFDSFKEKLQNYSNKIWGCYKVEFERSGGTYIHAVLGGDVPSQEWLKKTWDFVSKEENHATT